MTKFILVRHGETEWNAIGRMQGHREVTLNRRGEQQANAVAKRLRNELFDVLYSSDLKRTMQTAKAIADVTHHKIYTDARLREWDLGILAGCTRSEAEAQHPEAYAIYRDSLVDAAVPEGESIRDRYNRVVTCLDALAKRHPGRTLVVVTHGGPLGDCYRYAKQLSFEVPLSVELYNGGLNVILIDDSVWSVEVWGDIAHLEDIGSMGDWEGWK